MARMPRLIVPGLPHHVTQRGNRRQNTFFSEGDYRRYINFVAEALDKTQASIWAYCLMPNHVHFVIVPADTTSVAALFSRAHRRYTLDINARFGWRGHLWQERFHSTVMDERHLIAAVRYVELNPIRAGLCQRPEDWPWSSIHAHLKEEDDDLVTVRPMLTQVSDWTAYLNKDEQPQELAQIREHSRTGRPLGDVAFFNRLEAITGKDWRKRKPGRKTKDI